MPTPAPDTDILIVGGGIAGLGAAIALARFGLRIVVIEKRTEVGGIHRGDSLLPKAVAQLTRWGLRAAIEQAGARPIARMEIHVPGSARAFHVPLTPENPDHPYLVLPHARLEAVLMDHARSLPTVRVIRPASFSALLRDAETGRVVGIHSRQGTTSEPLYGRVIVAADGQHSRVRQSLGLAFEAYHYDHAYLGLEAERPAGYADAMRLHFHREGGVLLMPHPEHIGVGMLVEAGSARHWLNLEPESLALELTKRAPILRGMPLHREGSHVYELTRAHAQAYVRDGAVLIGDAAHCTNPTAGQGMAMALTDAGNLADALGPAWTTDSERLDHALATFEAGLWQLNQRQVDNSHRLALLYALRGPAWTRLKRWGVLALARPGMRHLTTPLIASFLQDRPQEGSLGR